MSELDEMREELNEFMGWPKNTNQEIGRSSFSNDKDWVIRRCHDIFGNPTWYATLEESEHKPK